MFSEDSNNMNSLFNSSSSGTSLSQEEFLQDTFSVDRFVSEHRKQASLESLRDDLGNYLRVLRAAMIELINKDYADFVHLSTSLVGLDKAISNLSVPLGQLKEEILSVKSAVGEALNNANLKLEQKTTIQQKKTLLQTIKFVVEEIERIEKLLGFKTEEFEAIQNLNELKKKWSGDIVERAIVQLSQVDFYLHKFESIPIGQKLKPKVSCLKNVLQSHLEESFKRSIESSDRETLTKILCIYTTINQARKLESLHREQIVKPFLKDVITEKAVEQDGIGSVFDKVLAFVHSNCMVLLNVTKGYYSVPGVRGYDFLTRSVWLEVVECLEHCTPYIFSPGNPDLFQQRYKDSMAFLEKFEALYSSKEGVRCLRQNDKYKVFLEKWNLEIYFRIRFQQIAGHLEKATAAPFEPPTGESIFLLSVTSSLWECLYQCWSDVTHLSPLTHKFWKLTLQLLSRYHSWAAQQMPEKDTPSRSREESPNTDANSVPPSSGVDQTDTRVQAEANILNVVKLVADIHCLENMIPGFFKQVVQPKVCLSTGSQDVTLLESALEDSMESLRELIPVAGKTIVKEVACCAAQTLKLVSDIPRLYRKTNREVPSKPSAYMNSVTETLEKFVGKGGTNAASFVWREEWTRSILEAISDQFLSVTGEVLTSVKKMEDSLKRLKRARASGNTSTQGLMGMSDDDKIRLQLWLDVEQFGKAIESLGIPKEEVKGYASLMELVTSARNSPSSNT